MVIDNANRSSTEPKLYHLCGEAALRPADTVCDGMPADVNGLPAFYYWKDAIFVGSYVHPTGEYTLDVTGEKLDAYVETFVKMKANGVGVPILADHVATAASTLGWIVDVKRDGDTLLELHQFLGESARDVALRNHVSLGIDLDFTDGLGRNYGEAIVHSAVTPVPVVPGQGGFAAVEMAGEIAGEIAGESDGVVTLSLAEKVTGVVTGSAMGQSVVPPAVVDTEPPAVCDADIAAIAVRQVVTMKRDAAIARGGIDPASATKVFDLLITKPATMNFSRGDTAGDAAVSIAAAIFDALAANKPVTPGEVTGLQVLSRLVPGDDRSELQKQMIALASGGG